MLNFPISELRRKGCFFFNSENVGTGKVINEYLYKYILQIIFLKLISIYYKNAILKSVIIILQFQ